MDPEIRKALANLKRRQAEINRKYGTTEDSGPLYDRSRRAKQERDRLDDDMLDEVTDDTDEDYLHSV